MFGSPNVGSSISVNREGADAGSIPAASTSGFKPKMDRDNRHGERTWRRRWKDQLTRLRFLKRRRHDCSGCAVDPETSDRLPNPKPALKELVG